MSPPSIQKGASAALYEAPDQPSFGARPLRQGCPATHFRKHCFNSPRPASHPSNSNARFLLTPRPRRIDAEG